jgi:hypothetical protein
MDEAAPQAVAVRTAEDQALEALRREWGWAYAIGHDDEHGWWAARHGGWMDADNTTDNLRTQIFSVYALKPVRRLDAKA